MSLTSHDGRPWPPGTKDCDRLYGHFARHESPVTLPGQAPGTRAAAPLTNVNGLLLIQATQPTLGRLRDQPGLCRIADALQVQYGRIRKEPMEPRWTAPKVQVLYLTDREPETYFTTGNLPTLSYLHLP